MSKELVPVEGIENIIFLIRGQKVMLDKDLSQLYGVATGSLNRQVRRNIDRFPSDFMFQLTTEEFNNLKCQFGISSSRCQIGTANSSKEQEKLQSQIVTSSWGGTRKPPFAFTEYGILMLSSVLKSQRAIDVNIQIMRTFARLRHMIAGNKELSDKLEQLEKRVFKHDSDIRELVKEIRKLTASPSQTPKRIGFLR